MILDSNNRQVISRIDTLLIKLVRYGTSGSCEYGMALQNTVITYKTPLLPISILMTLEAACKLCVSRMS